MTTSNPTSSQADDNQFDGQDGIFQKPTEAFLPFIESGDLGADNWRAFEKSVKAMLTHLDDQPKTFKGDSEFTDRSDDSSDLLYTSRRKATRARDAFLAAVRNEDRDESEANYFEACKYLLSLWETTSVRTKAFRSLLGAIDVAVRHNTIHQFNDDQKAALRQAFISLAKYHLDQSGVSEAIKSFARCGIDLSRPVVSGGPTGFRVTLEELK